MNTERLLAVALAIEEEKQAKFNMAQWIQSKYGRSEWMNEIEKITSHCGTNACIAGHAALLFRGTIKPEPMETVEGYARRVLELKSDEAFHLFYASGPHGNPNLGNVTKDGAIKVLMHAVEHKVIDWSVGKPG